MKPVLAGLAALALTASAAWGTDDYDVHVGLDDLYVYSEEVKELDLLLDVSAGCKCGKGGTDFDGRDLKVVWFPDGTVRLHVRRRALEGSFDPSDSGWARCGDAVCQNFELYWTKTVVAAQPCPCVLKQHDALRTRLLAKVPDYRSVSAMQTLAEVGLRVHDGLVTVDLAPGMGLSIENAIFHRPSSASGAAAGYVDAGTTTHVVHRRRDGGLTLDPFLATMDYLGVPLLVQPRETDWHVAGNVVDLDPRSSGPPEMTQATHLRLVMPQSVPSSQSDLFLPCNVPVLIGANETKDLDNWQCEGGVGTLDSEETRQCALEHGKPTRCRSVTRFRGRVHVAATIPITVRRGDAPLGTRTDIRVPIGATLRNVVEAATGIELTRDQSKHVYPRFHVERFVEQVRRDVAISVDPLPHYSKGYLIDPLDLPVVPGDVVVITAP